MRADAVRWFAGAALALLTAPAPVDAQEVFDDSLTVIVPPSIALEPALYDGGGRREPFDPLTVGVEAEAGPRFETLRLTGVFLGSPGNSLAVLEDPARRGHFLRVGERIAGARLIQILPDAAVFEVEEYGAARRVVLRLARNEEKP